MNSKTTLIVLMIAILLGAYFILFETDSVHKNSTDENPAEPHTAAGMPLLPDAPPPAQVQQVTIALPNHKPCVVVRQTTGASSGWKQANPFEYEMTDWKIDGLVTDALALRYTSKIRPKDLAAYDLKTPDAVLTIQSAQGEHTFKLGAVAPAGGAYLMLDDQPDVYVVDADLHEKLLGKAPADFRSTSLPNIPFGQVQQVTLQREDLNITVDRGAGSTDWVFADGASGRASAESVESLVNAINFGSIDRFVADQPTDLAAYGLDHPAITLTVMQEPVQAKTESEKKSATTDVSHTLRVGSATDLSDTNYFAMFDNQPVVFTLSKSSIERLTKPLSDLRDPRLTPERQADVREVTIKHGDETTVHLQKVEGRWKFADPQPGYELEPSSVDQLLSAIFSTKAAGYADMAQTKDTKELANVTLAVAGAAQPEVLTVFSHGEQQLMVRRDTETTGYLVDHKTMDVALKPMLYYRDRTVMDEKADDIAAIHIERTGVFPATYQIGRDKDGKFELAGMDHQAFDAMLKALTPLRAAEWLANAEDFKQPDQTITLTGKDGKTRSIQLQSNASLGKTEAGVFTLNIPTMDALTAELHDRVVIALDVDQIAAVSYDKINITRDRNGQINVNGATLSGELAGKLIDQLAGLRAEHFVPDGWAKMDVAHPARMLKITPREGDTIELSIWPANHNDRNAIIGRIGEGPLFTLGANPMDTLKSPEK